MSAFTGPLSLTELDRDWRLWRLDQPLRYEVGRLGSGQVIEAPAGMITDGASVPQPLWSVLSPWGPYSRAAAIHDRLCYLIASGAPHPLARTYARAADVLLEAMAVAGAPLAQRTAMWAAVRAWFTIPDRFRPGDANLYPCGSVQPLSVVLDALATARPAGSGPRLRLIPGA